MNRLIIISFVFYLMTTFCFSQSEIIFRVSEHPPYYFLEDGKWTGLSVELINILLIEAGYSITYKNIPWKRALVDIKLGNIDAMANLSITEEREEFIHFIGPQMDESMVLFLPQKSEYTITNFDDIKKISGKIGIQLGVYYGEEFSKKFDSDLEFQKKFVIIKDGSMYGVLYKNSRLIGFIINRYVFYYNQFLNDEYKDLKEHSFVINEDLIYFGFSKNNFSEDEIIKLQKVHNKIMQRGDYKKILNKYRGFK
ncbi:MAG: ABC transporter substrate-binding protein [Spirochaetaceae bacterium]